MDNKRKVYVVVAPARRGIRQADAYGRLIGVFSTIEHARAAFAISPHLMLSVSPEDLVILEQEAIPFVEPEITEKVHFSQQQMTQGHGRL